MLFQDWREMCIRDREIPKLGLYISDLRVYCLNLITLLFRYLQGLGLGKGSACLLYTSRCV